MEQDEVTLARRRSGGGAVYQDLGNTCFTFLAPKQYFNVDDNNEVLLGALKSLGITVRVTSSHDHDDHCHWHVPLWLLPPPVFPYCLFCMFVCMFCIQLQAELKGRNDIVVDGRKISGSAFKHTRDRSLHHGTLLLNLDLEGLARYLTPDKLKLEVM